MHTERSGQGWKLLTVMLLGLTILFIVLVAVGASYPRGSENTHRGRLLRVQADSAPQDQSSPNFLKDFVLIPGTAVLIDDSHVLAMYQNPEKDFYALVLFSVECGQASCAPTALLAFSIVDGEGKDVQLAEELMPKSSKHITAATPI